LRGLTCINSYRLNIFGYPNAKGLTDLNPGLLDQRKAYVLYLSPSTLNHHTNKSLPRRVEWTHDNIAAFGGDPNRITLWGQSAGGASASLYTYAYPSDPIVSSVICDSGSAELPGSTDTAQSNFTFLAGLVNCSNLGPQSTIACVQKVPAVTLENALSNYAISGAKPTIAFTPFPDNKTSFGNFTDRAVRGLVATIVSHFVVFLRTS
jgi:hypothetical protein